MVRYLILILALIPICLSAQMISTIAGNGSVFNLSSVPATTVAISNPAFGRFDKFGNYFFAEEGGNIIRKIDVNGIIYTVAGSGSGGFSGDGGLATNAELKGPSSVYIDEVGNLFICDLQNFRLRKVDARTQIITTIAGNGIGGYVTDNVPATSTAISNIMDVCMDKHKNLYIADYGNGRVRKIDTFGIITTFVGTGMPGYSGDGSKIDTCKIGGIMGIYIDVIGNMYLGSNSNCLVLKIDTLGIIHTLAGKANCYLYNGDGIPATTANLDIYFITLDKYDNLYIADRINSRIRMVKSDGIITTVAGNGDAFDSGDGSMAIDAAINYPNGIAIDSCGNLYINESPWNGHVRKVTYPHCNYMDVKDIEEKNAERFSIYPNPTSQYINITCNELINNICIFNAIGQKVLETVFNQTQKTEIDIGFLPAGVYYMCVNRQHWGKVVKE